ncbi:phosphoglucosamine mutase [Porphyromonas levii]|uniref:Phosphoglucosamine mutase n=1 Tax=Porphyromonas levii TaxID=28114 RepID=A0A4Y8WT09_9PORP|nr:phosphoglucosamine mutase [Porphyromonas levii]MBR8703280.1 Phosphomannomutase/phosphoglucomutase [Porphyromonas levii]MBR8713211.1 Phosphomannomutase/phosphoglucomutase [Porphyromonas levii]MBR8715216.1 Phosphomannomutase/phosphoglucomutase [Porphyromonas levii]MBR8727742.1 Phosphomannomutase/phosphoglucomutase [Porphyromonas levii]MBR8731327.1 Phosphomannomutase/phosphoglucomutase [Porphyromonas levii]
MSLITSISGIRGTIGGGQSDGLNPINIAEFTASYAQFIRKNSPVKSGKIVVGRDARMSGDMVRHVVIGTLLGMGFEVVDLGLATTPTTELAVIHEKADGGIIITASHNPRRWNALKLLNHNGEFLSSTEGGVVLEMAKDGQLEFADVDQIGKVTQRSYTDQHIQDVLALPEVDVEAIRKAGFVVAVDTINSVGGVVIPQLLEALGVKEYHIIYGEPTGDFAHNPEPLPQNLVGLSSLVKEKGAHVGFSVDPDVDRLAIYSEDGTPFGEEYTLVSVADYLLELYPGGNTVSNLSSTRALRDVTLQHGGEYFAAAVGEVNVTTKMKEVGALIGGEGNGGVIYPKSHYGRDSLVGIALYLTLLAKRNTTPTKLLATLPTYYMVKKKAELTPDLNVDQILKEIENEYKGKAEVTTIDGVKLDFPDKWVHLRKSNTEPIVRIYAEAQSNEEATAIADEIIKKIER